MVHAVDVDTTCFLDLQLSSKWIERCRRLEHRGMDSGSACILAAEDCKTIIGCVTQ
jgi:hypothetical protein